MLTSAPPFAKLLVANRGEIAVRVMRACRELGIRTVAVYSEADAGALHVRMADEAVLLGASPPNESYLNMDRIIAAARQSGAQAIHPGYGFLSENAAFAAAVAAAGLVFIGPPASAIRAMGDKAESKLSMQAAGVPTIPGAQGLATLDDYLRAADRIGYPVLVKAAAGGGGRGMRVVQAPQELPEALEAARREALNAFGDERLLLEKYLQDAHHVEFQLLGDRHGSLLQLFERECSVQRRHQKIIEETPSPLMDPDLRARMSLAALDAARAVGYFNAGTVEFIVDPATREFYFLEMNTRLQVEHPVTELVVGLDLVQWQIRIAAGQPLTFTQADLTQRGHAIECRLYAEDPAGGFLPATGQVLALVEPRGPGIRLDSGVALGSQVSHFYDPLLAKLIVHAEDRPAAIRRMQDALRGLVLHGITTNLDFLQSVLAHPDFQSGRVTTRWVESVFAPWAPNPQPPVEALIAAALAGTAIDPSPSTNGAAGATRDPYSPWKTPDGFRIGQGNDE
ncbi:MAG TPA: acetyl-CoA carboxylase biotin carboxylase subunit [Anaerolineales bacterium]|jgi:acetyl-CoA carboxylase biotin carboxylase subunit